ncbi:hypothetical protein ACVXHB_10630 [Escherichia coli]
MVKNIVGAGMLIAYSDKNHSFGCLNSSSASLRLNANGWHYPDQTVAEEQAIRLAKKSKTARTSAQPEPSQKQTDY